MAVVFSVVAIGWFGSLPRTGGASGARTVAVVQRITPALPPTIARAAPTASRVDADWLATTSKDKAIPELALDAYARAALALSVTVPTCHLGWNTLAALGWAESAHSGMSGTSLAANGDSVPKIVGPALDGTTYAAIHDTDDGSVDGDSRWDRAVGPLQFLPATWADYGSDGNDDGATDPNNIYDASLGAARFLCSTGGDLAVAPDWEKAVTAYNPNLTYLTEVRSRALDYGDG